MKDNTVLAWQYTPDYDCMPVKPSTEEPRYKGLVKLHHYFGVLL